MQLYKVLNRRFEKIEQRLHNIENRLIQIEDQLEVPLSPYLINVGVDLPDRLRASYFALKKLGGNATATQVAEITKRTRAIESSHLTQLTFMHFLSKKRQGHFVVYEIKHDQTTSLMKVKNH